MAPPRHRRKRRPSRVVGGPAQVVEPEPESPPMAPPRRGLMGALIGPTAPVRPAPPGPAGPPWVRRDWYVLSGMAALVVVVVGLLTGLVASISTTVGSKPAPTTSSFAVASGFGKSFLCGQSIVVGSAQAQVASINADQLTLSQPLASVPSAGTTVVQKILTPTTVAVCGSVASSPAPTTTQFTLAGGAGYDFGVNATADIGGEVATVKSINSTSYRITLASALPSAPQPGTAVSQLFPYPGSLILGIFELAIGEFSFLVLAVAAWVARPFATRFVKKRRPGLLETLVFGVVVAVVNVLVYVLGVGTLGSTNTPAGASLVDLGTVASGFVLVPAAYPAISRLFRRSPRQAGASRSGR